MLKTIQIKVAILALALAPFFCFAQTTTCNETGEGAYYTGVYRNVFKEVLGKTDSEIDSKVNSSFQQIFYGSSTQKLYYEVGTDMAYILDVNNNDVRTEGMSYGMMICVQLNKQAEFNKIWKWAKTYMQYGSSSVYDGYFAWQCNSNGTIKGNGPASDGEAYFITALFFAANRWGNGTGINNYEAEAQDILKRVMNKSGNGGVYPLFNQTSKLITFVPYYSSYEYTDPSYNLPGFWELWKRWGTSNTSFWAQTPDASRKLLRNASHSTSGLTADYSNFDGTPYEASFNTNSDKFMYDAWRTIMNIGMDYHWFKADAEQVTITNKYLTFFKNQGTSYKNHYDWNGSNVSGEHSTGLVACNAVAALSTTNTTLAKPFVQEFWSIAIPTGTYRYYDGMLYMLSLLHCSGKFKVWKPACVTCTKPAKPAVSTISYCKDVTANPLTATASVGNTLRWYGTNATNGTASATAPTPSTTSTGTTTFYVSQVTADGKCESDRTGIVVTINSCDCSGTINGTATLDNCDRCVSGTTGKVACTSAGEAEIDACSYDGTIDNNNLGFKGTGFINVPNAIGSEITFHVNATSAGTKTLSFIYASGGTADRKATININGTALANTLSFPATGAFTTYKTIEVNLTLTAGINIVQLVSTTTDGLANIDQIGYVSAGLSKGSCEEVVTSAENPAENLGILIYPNPFTNHFTVQQNGIFTYQILSPDGKEIESGGGTDAASIGESLPIGAYILKVQNQSSQKVMKIVKSK